MDFDHESFFLSGEDDFVQLRMERRLASGENYAFGLALFFQFTEFLIYLLQRIIIRLETDRRPVAKNSFLVAPGIDLKISVKFGHFNDF